MPHYCRNHKIILSIFPIYPSTPLVERKLRTMASSLTLFKKQNVSTADHWKRYILILVIIIVYPTVAWSFRVPRTLGKMQTSTVRLILYDFISNILLLFLDLLDLDHIILVRLLREIAVRSRLIWQITANTCRTAGATLLPSGGR